MRWLAQRGGALDYKEWVQNTPDEPFPIAVALGADPATILGAVTPVPDTLSEYAFAGLLRGSKTEVVKCALSDLQVPASAEYILEGFIYPNEVAEEGPGRPRDRVDDVRPSPQARRGGSRQLRRVVARDGHPCRGAMPGARQEADDRLVRAGDPRVLRGQRGQRVRLLQQRAVARARRHGRHGDHRLVELHQLRHALRSFVVEDRIGFSVFVILNPDTVFAANRTECSVAAMTVGR